MKLYAMPGSCSMVAHVALHWIGKPFEYEALTREDLKDPSYVAHNPLSSVPCLQDGNFYLNQNSAIIHYLDRKFPEYTLFGSQFNQQKALGEQWFAFCNTDLHKSFAPLFIADRLFNDLTLRQTYKEQAITQVMGLLDIANQRLTEHEYLSGKKSMADVYLWVILSWMDHLQIPLDLNYLPLIAFKGRILTDEGVQKARKIEAKYENN